MVVHQVLCAAGPVDAVTNQGFTCRRRFAGWGWKGGDVAAVLAPGMDRRAMRSLSAAIVLEGLCPTGAGMIEPSAT